MPTNRKNNPKKKPIDRLTMWEWDTLVAAWRYYEHGATITSSMFPEDIVRRYWGKDNPYSDKVRNTIAHQFAIVDHGLNGEKDWTGPVGFKLLDCDLRPWTTFYRFCEAWVKGFTPLKIKNPDTGKTESVMAFHVDYTDYWLGRDFYIMYGSGGHIAPEYILHIPKIR